MKFAITGSLGHIGSLLIRRLPEWYPDCEIIMFDDMSAQRYCSLFNLPNTAKYTFIEKDISKIELSEFIKGSDALFHLAAITNAAGSFENPEKVELNNYNSTLKVADACLENSVPLVYLSSTSVYGTSNDQVDENCSIEELRPQSPYATTKLKEESYVSSLNIRGLHSVTFRFGTIFGISPGMRFHTAVNKFCWQACVGQPLTIWRTAYNQLRPYLDIEDAMNAFEFTIKKNIFNGETYNVLTSNNSVETIISEIKSHIPDIKIEFVDSKIMNQLSYEVIDKKFRNKGFAHSGSLTRGISDTIKLLRY